MGGRGKMLGKRVVQTDLREAMRKNNVARILEETRKIISKEQSSNYVKQGITGISGIASKPKRLLKKCACCGNKTIPNGTEYEVCPICGWVDDPFQNSHPDSINGHNKISLKEAKKRWNK